MLQLIDLRRAALREYPEFGGTLWPVPWYRDGTRLIGLILVIYAMTQAVLILAILF